MTTLVTVGVLSFIAGAVALTALILIGLQLGAAKGLNW